MHPVLRPRQREARVQDPARVERGRGVVDHRQRRDGGEARRPPGGDEQLADPAVGHARHADLAVQRPGLPGDRLDHVVAVERLQRLEVVERAARAAGPAHVHVDHGVAEQVQHLRDRALAAVRVRVAVAGVLDDRRVRPGAGRQPHVDRELRPVARGQVAVAARRDPLPVAPRARRRRPVGQHPERGERVPRAAPCSRAPAATRRNTAPPSPLARRVATVRPPRTRATFAPGAAPVTCTCSTLPRAAGAAAPGRPAPGRGRGRAGGGRGAWAGLSHLPWLPGDSVPTDHALVRTQRLGASGALTRRLTRVPPSRLRSAWFKEERR